MLLRGPATGAAAPCTRWRGLGTGRACTRRASLRAASLPVSTNAVISDQDQELLELLKTRFKTFDVGGKGELGKDQLRQLLQSLDTAADSRLLGQLHNWIPESEVERVVEAYDKDQSGTLNFQEYLDVVTDGLLLDGTLSEYEAAFKAVDKSGNGTIGAMELAQLFKNLTGQEMSFEKLSGLMETYDKDESGQIEFDEFLLMFRDQLLDLREMQNWLAGVSSKDSASKSQDILDVEEGGISLIFSEQELEAVMARTDKNVVIYTALTWCRPCKAMAKPLSRMAQHYKDSYVFIKLFANSNEQTKRIFKDVLKVRSTPCFMIFKDQQLLHTQLGPNKEKLEDALRHFVLEGKMPKGRLYFPQT